MPPSTLPVFAANWAWRGSPGLGGRGAAQLPQTSPARPFLAAALELAGKQTELAAAERTAKDKWLAEFEASEVASKPIGFYDWTPELVQVWRFFRFLQHEFPRDDAIPRDVAAVLKASPELLKQYRAINAFYGRLTNPQSCLPVDALLDGGQPRSVAVFPPLTSREVELFNRMFPDGVPSGVNLMAVLVNRIRSGEVDSEARPAGRLVPVPGVRPGDAAAAGQGAGAGQAAAHGGL